MNHFGFILVIIGSICLRDIQLLFVEQSDLELIKVGTDHLEDVRLPETQPDVLDMTYVEWQLMIPFLMQRQQLRLCMSIYRYDQHLIVHTPCEQLLSNEPMAYFDIGNVEQLSKTMCKEFSSILFDTMKQCRAGLEIFGMRCRRRV